MGNTLTETFKIKNKEIIENKNESIITASHNGYEKKFGYICKRSIKISKTDPIIIGSDLFKKIKNSKIETSYFVRFHIYPGLKIAKTKDGSTVLIQLINGEGLIFKSENNEVKIEKNIFLGGKNIINTKCIVISGITREKEISVNWKIEKVL